MYVYIIVVGGVACYKSGWGYYHNVCRTTGGCACANIKSLLSVNWRIIGYYINTGLYYVHNVY